MARRPPVEREKGVLLVGRPEKDAAATEGAPALVEGGRELVYVFDYCYV